jgi:hypothetical protein
MQKNKEIAITPMDLGNKASSNITSSFSEENKHKTKKANDK